MKDRYCIVIQRFNPNPYYSDLQYDDEAHFFDSAESAELYRKWCKRKGYNVSDVIDRDNLPF